MGLRMNKQASIELSINMIVKLIIAVVVFSMGMLIVKQIFFKADVDEISPALSKEVEYQIKALINTGERITIYPEQLSISKDDSAVFGLGILNVLGGAYNPAEFHISIECSGFIPKGGSLEACPTDPKKLPSTLPAFEPLVIKNNEDDYYSIPMRSHGIASGMYIYNVIIDYDNNINGVPDSSNLQTYGIVKFRLEVK